MTFDAENMENKIGIQNYEKPSLKKYGTMKEFTLDTSGSGGDMTGQAKETPDFNNSGSRAFPVDNRGIGENLNDDSQGGDDVRT